MSYSTAHYHNEQALASRASRFLIVLTGTIIIALTAAHIGHVVGQLI